MTRRLDPLVTLVAAVLLALAGALAAASMPRERVELVPHSVTDGVYRRPPAHPCPPIPVGSGGLGDGSNCEYRSPTKTPGRA